MMKPIFIISVIYLMISCSSTEETLSTSGELNGGWLPIKQEIGGQELPPDSFENQRLAIVEKSFLFVADGADQGSVTYGNGKMDIYIEVGVNAGRHFKAIYNLENNMLSICYDLSGGTYPESFDTTINPKIFLTVFRKE